ncbi:probable sulfatase atsG [Lentisphaera araneosa HTCC2155]|uniref:Probable sulfatase atsG n=1 Tax=Lentisphaera araneosa HTCC2155 TaxID=313628 RepID=A6DQD9_9BACT|nr:sulfatase [Lentisphaera araneosa]EDM26190.1 probable sulfatase atsG [Lentisphaera araneosa HTCC2155]
MGKKMLSRIKINQSIRLNIFVFFSILSLICTVEAKTEPYNIIWVMAEDIGQDLECYGMKGVKTPNLNRLAKEGTLYTNCFVTNSICSPSRSAMMVGASQNTFDAQHHRSNRDKPLPTPLMPMTYWLREQGYTAILGHEKVFNYGMKVDCNFKVDTFGEYDGVSKFGLFDKKLSFTSDDQPFYNHIQLKVTHRGDWWADIRDKSKAPVKLDEIELPPYMADTPEIRYDWACYLDTIEYADMEVGLLMEDLKSKGLYNNTIIIFIGDNGRCNIRGKGYLYDPGVRVPLIVWAPGLVEAGKLNDDLLSTLDITASIVDLSGSAVPDYMTGTPFIGKPVTSKKEFIHSARDIWDEVDECSRLIRDKKFAYIKNYMPQVSLDAKQAYLDLNRPAVHVMRDLKDKGKLKVNEKAFFEENKQVEELYDIERDPHQINNLANNPEYKRVLATMREREAGWKQNNVDFGLKDLNKRQPGTVKAKVVWDWLKVNKPEIISDFKRGKLMKSQQLSKKVTLEIKQQQK